MLLLQRECKPVDNGAQNLQELCNPIVSLSFVDEVVEDVIYLFPNVRPQTEKLPINPMQGGFQEISLSRILGVEQGEEL